MSIWFRGLRAKLLLLSLIPTFFLIVIGFQGYNGMCRLDKNLDKANLVRGPLITHSGEMLLHATSVARWTVTAMWSYAEPKERESAIKNAESSVRQFDETMEKYLKLPRSDKAKEIFKSVEEAWPVVKRHVSEILPEIEKAKPETIDAIKVRYIENVRPQLATIIGSITELNKARAEMMERETKEDDEFVNEAFRNMALVGIFAVVISLAFSTVFLRGIIGNLNKVMGSLSQASQTVASASEELSASSTQVASSSAETASAIQETVSSLEEITSMIKQTDDSSQAALSLTDDTRKQAQVSEQKLSDLVESLKNISSSSEKVTAIIEVIDDISFQTNLLALNAAVEAARAGEQGKGFAVVAEAVRALAQKSASSAKEIGDLIRESVDKTKTGVDLGNQCKDLMGHMFDSLKKVTQKSQEIAHSSHEQNTGMGQISKAMNQLDQATQQNATASNHISSASNELSTQATSLSHTVETLRELVDGHDPRGRFQDFLADVPKGQPDFMPKQTMKPALRFEDSDMELPRVS